MIVGGSPLYEEGFCVRAPTEMLAFFIKASSEVHRYISRLTEGDHQLPEDIVQDTFIALLAHHRPGDGIGRPQSSSSIKEAPMSDPQPCRMLTRRATATLLAVVTLIAAGCGDDSGDGNASGASTADEAPLAQAASR